MITPFNEDFSFLALQYCAHHSPPKGVSIAGEVRLAPWALRVLLRQVDEVAERAKFDDQKMDIFVKSPGENESQEADVESCYKLLSEKEKVLFFKAGSSRVLLPKGIQDVHRTLNGYQTLTLARTKGKTLEDDKLV